ncbi:MAG: ROK family protein [Rhizobiales bacterium]|nr:ROK family protein [Hyphomicrobiales bacterium]
MSFISASITTEGLRHYNRATLLNAIREFGPLSHTEITQKTSLASGTVSVITAEFLDESVIEKLEQAPATGRGRPRILFGLKADFAHIVLVRISAEQIEFSLVDYREVLLDRKTVARDRAHVEISEFGAVIKSEMTDFIARSKLKPKDIKIVSITTKGEIDEANQILLWSAVFDDQRLDFNALLAPQWTAEIELSNEACFVAYNLMAKSLRKNDATIGDRHAVLSLSDSISLGIAKVSVQGEIELSSPSFGHMPHSHDGGLCRCGVHGCLETHAGFYGILRFAFNAPKDIIPAKFIPLDQMRKIAEAARNGDRMMGFAFAQAGQALGICLSRVFNILGPMPLTIVGAGTEFYDLMEEGVEEHLDCSFQTRMGSKSVVALQPHETQLAFDSNVFVSLRKFDRSIVATRQYMKRSK